MSLLTLTIGLTLNFEAGFAHLSFSFCCNFWAVQHLALFNHQGVAQAIVGCLETITQSDRLIVHEPDQLDILWGNHTLKGCIFSFQHCSVVEFSEELNDSGHWKDKSYEAATSLKRGEELYFNAYLLSTLSFATVRSSLDSQVYSPASSRDRRWMVKLLSTPSALMENLLFGTTSTPFLNHWTSAFGLHTSHRRVTIPSAWATVSLSGFVNLILISVIQKIKVDMRR